MKWNRVSVFRTMVQRTHLQVTYHEVEQSFGVYNYGQTNSTPGLQLWSNELNSRSLTMKWNRVSVFTTMVQRTQLQVTYHEVEQRFGVRVLVLKLHLSCFHQFCGVHQICCALIG